MFNNIINNVIIFNNLFYIRKNKYIKFTIFYIYEINDGINKNKQ